MGRGRSSFGGSSGGSRGSSSFGRRHSGRGFSNTTIFIGDHGHHGGGVSGSIVGIIVGIMFIMSGLSVSFFGITECFNVNDYSKVSAICVDNEYSNMDGYYYAIYDYTIDGKFYDNVRSNQGWQFREDVGKEVTIYYLESNPNEISEDCPVSVSGGLLMVAFGVIFAAFGSLPLIICIKSLKKEKIETVSGETKTSIPEDTDVRCYYCGAKFNKKSDSCPKCGAGKM